MNSVIDKDIFEKVVDDLMLERYSDNPEIKDYIESLPKENKRVAILSLIGDDNLLWSKINDILRDRNTGYQRLKKVYELLKDYVKIADVERKKHGEILTPFKELAEPMVRLVEKYDPEFWKNPNHKVLDSSAGYGTFLILAAYKFMVGLKDWEPDEEKRFKWVVENCLYYGELQARSVFSWLVAIDPYDEYKTNTYYGSFLTEDFDKHAKDVWNVEKWDLIIQNPPYQEQREGFKETQPLWHFFVQKSLKLIKSNGYMMMVHPSGWRNINGSFSNLQKEMIKNQILELNINSEEIGQKIFGATTGFDYYLMKNVPKYKDTLIVSKDGESRFDISKFGFIPSGKFNEFNSILAKDDEERVDIIHDYSYERRKKIMSKNRDSYFQYPCVYTISKNKNITFYYSSDKIGHFGVPKVIWSNGKASTPICDYDGIYGMTGFAYGISDRVENLDSIRNAMSSDEFIAIMKCCDVNDGNRFNKRVMSLLKKDFWKEFISYDLSKYLETKIRCDEKILILGCGVCEGDNKYRERKENIKKLIHNYKNIHLSDIDHLDKSKLDWWGIPNNKYKKIDLLTDQIKDRYDYIDLRYILHFTEFKDRIIEILESLRTNNLRSNGRIGVQIYPKRLERDTFSYDPSDVEMKYLSKFLFGNGKDDNETFYSYIIPSNDRP